MLLVFGDGFTEFFFVAYLVFPWVSTSLFLVVLGSFGFYWVLLGFTGF